MIPSRGWYDYNWNPVVGCKRACDYCYANKYATDRKWVADFSEPEFHSEALFEPDRIPKPSTILVCAYADLFGGWISDVWIQNVINRIAENTRHTFVFLTKSPERYREFQYPSNVYLGVTIEAPELMWRAEAIRDLPYRKLASIEPVMGDFSGVDLSMFDWVVAGYMLHHKTTKRERMWMRSIVHSNKYQIIR